jgi:DNA-binding beta-propeller fold protein YncE
MSNGSVLTLSGTPTTGDAVFPYTYNPTNGQLTLNQNTAQPLGITQATAILQAGSTLYVLDNEPITIASGSTFNAGTYPSQILPYTVGSGGALQAQTSGAVPDASQQSNPVWAMLELGSSGKFLYVANQGNNVQGNNTASGIAGYFMTNSPSFQLSFIAGQPWSTGSGPRCLIEDPSNQFVYTANYNDSTVTGRIIDPNSGVLTTMRKQSKFSLPGPPTWCLVDGRTN